MYPKNVEKVLSLIDHGSKVLDVGGWARPFRCANYVIDSGPYETRGSADRKLTGGRVKLPPVQGGDREWFTRETWVHRDICAREPWPFADKEFDFVICAQALQYLRDPLWVCSEMIRVAKRGYLETTSRLAESSRGIEPNQVGWSHHRWFVTITHNHVYFMMKYHKIHSHWRLSLPATRFRQLPADSLYEWLFWDDSFAYSEVAIRPGPAIERELEGYIRRVGVYPGWMLKVDRRFPRISAWFGRKVAGLGPAVGRADQGAGGSHGEAPEFAEQ
jgi:hypothetical protein